ncbi:MAG: cobyric acid synthase [Methanomassiliicoccales archaeon PtaU1.Bin124]|nr:MAG: cobyric acid synthase [Methanomassiliicoccales archaeon PtaU1.Bin124]
MIDCAAKVKEQMEKGDIGSNRSCEYYPCHHEGQNCSLCFCPFYPCLDPLLGRFVPSRKGGEVWSCEGCHWVHRDDVVRSFFSKVGKGPLSDHDGLMKIKEELQNKHLRIAKTLMVLGATSGAGKSLLTTAFCRHFADQGWKVSPFKGQNMSLNSMVTPEGEEMARAQELQAKGARAVPSSRMNPILLKPMKDDQSQVIVEGRPYKDMRVAEYYDMFAPKEGVEIIRRNIDLLRRINDIVVIEGAGSPAEINMMDKDITNLLTAEMAEAACVLVVNIEWGGAFAYAYGTLMLLPERQRRMFVGTIITNLHGDGSCLRSGEEFLHKTTGVPVIGILPHLELDLPDEDSMFMGTRPSKAGSLKVGVLQLPRISNFTDFDALALSGAEVMFIDRPEQVRQVDAIIVPGTKNTVSDLEWLRSRSLDRAIVEARGNKPILGVCGGYQMLGEIVDDSKGIEGSEPKVWEGLGLLPLKTKFEAYEKRTVQVQGHILGTGGAVRGYEIHMGRTERSGGRPIFLLSEGNGSHEEGTVSEDGMVFGTYLHGVFDLPSFRELFLGKARKGEVAADHRDDDRDTVVERSLEQLARAVERSVDVVQLHRSMGLPEVKQ